MLLREFFFPTVQRETSLNGRWWRTQLRRNKYINIYIYISPLWRVNVERKTNCTCEYEQFPLLLRWNSKDADDLQAQHMQPFYFSNRYFEKTTCTTLRTIIWFILLYLVFRKKVFNSRSINFLNMWKSKKSNNQVTTFVVPQSPAKRSWCSAPVPFYAEVHEGVSSGNKVQHPVCSPRNTNKLILIRSSHFSALPLK